MANRGSFPKAEGKINEKKEQQPKRGRLKIFFGYAHGVGKTHAMLKTALKAKNHGVDVVCGFISDHHQGRIDDLAKKLETLTDLETKSGREFNLDAAIARKPQLILVDDLAHSNAESCRHAKRYQDVKELLRAGIDVYTTVNVQNIEGLSDTIASITQTTENERIPDSIFDNADQVELVDIEPQELTERLNAEKSGETAHNTVTAESLTALREVALRRCADRINALTEKESRFGNYHTDEHILVCLSSSPSNEKIIRTAARMAKAYRGAFTALFVETPDFSALGDENIRRLRSHMRLAQQLGANIETVYGDDIPFQIAEFARLSGVSEIVIGRSAAAKKSFFHKPTLTDRLISHAPNLDVHIIPDTDGGTSAYREKKAKKITGFDSMASDILKSSGILILATLIGVFFHQLGFAEANIILVYVLGVLLTTIVTNHRRYSLISAVVSVLIFNFLFTVPKFSFLAYDQGYPVTFLIMFLAAFLTGSLAIRMKNNARQSAQAAFRTKVLFETNQLLQQAENENEIITATAKQLQKLLGKDIVFYFNENNELGDPLIFSHREEEERDSYISPQEKSAAAWVLHNNKHAGATTDTFSEVQCLYLAVRINDRVYGVVGIVIGEEPPDAFENSILLSILGECALTLENEKNAREKEKAAILAKNEQLRANLLRAISHDLRTPLTSISGNASNLLSNGDSFDRETKNQLYSDIYDDSLWLINLVENLLSVTRIEEGRLNLRISEDLMDDVITEALRHINRKSAERSITVDSKEEFLLAKMDAKLIVQVVINIVDNAIKYTPPGSHIQITTEKQGNEAVVTIADDGNGIPDEMKPRVFDMFYTGANQIADSRRSLGMGLALCKSIINAHGGRIFVSDNVPRGTVFTFTLPAREVTIHE